MALTPQQLQSLFFSNFGGHGMGAFNAATPNMDQNTRNQYINQFNVGGTGYGQYQNWLQQNKGARIQEQLSSQPNSIFAPMWQSMLGNSANNYKPTAGPSMGGPAPGSANVSNPTNGYLANPTNGSWNVNAQYGDQNQASTAAPAFNWQSAYSTPGQGAMGNPTGWAGQTNFGTAPATHYLGPMSKDPTQFAPGKVPTADSIVQANPTPMGKTPGVVQPPTTSTQPPSVVPPGGGAMPKPGLDMTPKSNFSFVAPGWSGGNFAWGGNR